MPRRVASLLSTCRRVGWACANRIPTVRQTDTDTDTESPWVCWRPNLFDSNPGGIGFLGSVERCFELCWRNVVAVPVQPVLVEPVDPGQGGEFEFVDVVPAVGVGAVDALGLVAAVGRA